ncbi:hypothetical protein J6590_067067 [Homalodisca vitripennis]|nr:hypothetical protein J6590_067067 [Homalodisca vitripennis]
MRSLLSPLPRAVTSPASSAPHTPPAAPAAICSTPDPESSPEATPSLPAAPTTPTAVAPAGSPPCAAVGTPDPPTPSTPCPSQLLLENQALNQKIFDLQEQMKVILNHSIESDQRLLDMVRAGVDGVTNVCGTCKPGAGLLNTIPDAAPPPDNCFILIFGNNDVAAGRQNIIFNNLEEIIKNCRTRPSRVANAYISELCVRSEGVEMLDISRIGRQFFTSHGQHIRESGKRLLTCLMIAHLATMAPDLRRHKPPLVAAPSHSLPTAMSRTEGGPDPDLQETPKQPRMLLCESFADAVKSTGHQQHGNILDNQNFLGNPLLVTKTN